MELGVEQLIVTVCELEYEPATGEKVGVAVTAEVLTVRLNTRVDIPPSASITSTVMLSVSAFAGVPVRFPLDGPITQVLVPVCEAIDHAYGVTPLAAAIVVV